MIKRKRKGKVKETVKEYYIREGGEKKNENNWEKAKRKDKRKRENENGKIWVQK